jgi:hypothetical protein
MLCVLHLVGHLGVEKSHARLQGSGARGHSVRPQGDRGIIRGRRLFAWIVG